MGKKISVIFYLTGAGGWRPLAYGGVGNLKREGVRGRCFLRARRTVGVKCREEGEGGGGEKRRGGGEGGERERRGGSERGNCWVGGRDRERKRKRDTII